MEAVGERVADLLKRLRRKQRLRGAIRRDLVPRDRLVEEGIAHGVHAGAERPIDPVLQCHNIGCGLDRKLVARCFEQDAPAAPIGDLRGVRRRRPDDLDARLLQVLAEPVEEPERDYRRRDGRNLEDRMTHGFLERGEGLTGSGQPQNARNADAGAIAADVLAQLSGNRIPEGSVLEAAGEVDRGEEAIGAVPRGCDANRRHIGGAPLPFEVGGGELGCEVLVAGESAEHDRFRPAQVAGGHARGSEAARLGRAGGGRQQEVAVERALPGKTCLLEPLEHQPSPGMDGVHSGARIGMARFAGDQPRHRLGRIGNRLRRGRGRVPDDVNGRKEEVERGEAGPHQDHLTPRLLHRSRRGQRGKARADHGDIGFHRCAATSAGSAPRPPP